MEKHLSEMTLKELIRPEGIRCQVLRLPDH